MNQAPIKPDALPTADRAGPSRSATIVREVAAREQSVLAPLQEPWTHEQWRILVDNVEYNGRCLRPAAALAAGISLQAAKLHAAALDNVAREPVDRKQANAVLGRLLSAYPSGRPADFDAYAENLLVEVGEAGVSLPVLILAAKKLRRTSKYLPAVSELVEAVAEAEKQLDGRRKVAEHVIRRLEGAQRAQELLDAKTDDGAGHE